MKIGFIGQGWIGKNYANDFEKRGYEIVRFALESPYNKNSDKIKGCDIVFVAVPTPTTPKGFDSSIIRNVLKYIGKDKTVVIKSTILPGITEDLQREYSNIYVFHSPEFLRETSAAFDAANPERNIIGMPIDNSDYRERANTIMSILPKAKYELICSAREAEVLKYAGNCFLATKVIFMNMLYDLSKNLDCNWDTVRDAMSMDERIGKSHMEPIHASGRGAGGHCFIKDYAAFVELYSQVVGDKEGINALKAIELKNIDLLARSNKDVDLIKSVHGKAL